ncbi:hypothetical protein HDV00_009715 [Rhizophlyctis rosea]|nr:hypothetical protein HDV00_009715 [Rhizophlyctis rosea]
MLTLNIFGRFLTTRPHPTPSPKSSPPYKKRWTSSTSTNRPSPTPNKKPLVVSLLSDDEDDEPVRTTSKNKAKERAPPPRTPTPHNRSITSTPLNISPLSARSYTSISSSFSHESSASITVITNPQIILSAPSTSIDPNSSSRCTLPTLTTIPTPTQQPPASNINGGFNFTYTNYRGIAVYGGVENYNRVAAVEAAEYARAIGNADPWKNALKAGQSPNNQNFYVQLGFAEKRINEKGAVEVRENLVRGLDTIFKLFVTIQTSIEQKGDKAVLTDMKKALSKAAFTTEQWGVTIRGPRSLTPVLGHMLFPDGVSGPNVLHMVLGFRHFSIHKEKRQFRAPRGIHADLINANTQVR